MTIPQTVEKLVAGQPYTCDTVGKSGSEVRYYTLLDELF